MRWKIKTWIPKTPTSEALAAAKDCMDHWINRHESTCQIEVLFVNNGYGVQYRPLMRVG